MIEITEQMRHLIESAANEGAFCLVATAAPDGWPQISPKGSMMVHDDRTLAFWERARGGTLDNARQNPRVSVYYRNGARKGELPRGSGWRFYGIARICESGPDRDRVMKRTPKAELDRDPKREGVAVLIELTRITDIAGNVLQESSDAP